MVWSASEGDKIQSFLVVDDVASHRSAVVDALTVSARVVEFFGPTNEQSPVC